MVWKIDAPQCEESAKIRWEAIPYIRGLGLDIGCGPSKVIPHAIGIDNRIDTQIFGIEMNPDMTVPDAADMPLFATESFDYIFSSHLLEHIQDYKKALKEWWRLVKKDGYMVLYLPHKKFYPNIGTEGANIDHKHDFTPQDIIAAMKEIGPSWNLVQNQERNNDNEYSFFQVFQKTDSGKQKQTWTAPKPKKTAALVRYGAIGDLIQTASVAKALKAENYHVTLFCESRGYEVTKHDPNIDAFFVQDKDQVPNLLLGEFWDYWQKKFDKFVNFSESVEGSLLALPGRIQHRWPHAMRHKHLNKNYLEFMHDIAGTTYDWFKEGQRFYATDEEKAWAKAEKAKAQGIVILWPLAGSSVHKIWAGNVWPITVNGEKREVSGWDTIMGRLLAATDATIVTVGDKLCEVLEQPWSKSERVWKRASKWTIRETLAFAEVADIVIGPETGVLNAVAYLDVPKIVFMSHSSVENLTRDWKNTTSLIPENTKCYPCHMMHYDWSGCFKQKQGESLCQSNIHFDAVWQALCKNIPIEHFKMPDKRIVGE